MYTIFYGETAVASSNNPNFAIVSGTIEQNKNCADKLTFTLAANNPERDTPQIRALIVIVKRNDTTVFKGDVISTKLKYDGSREITCQGCLAWLNDVCNAKIAVASTVSGTFHNRIARYNSLCKSSRVLNEGKCTNQPSSTVRIKSTDVFMTVFDYFKELISRKGGIMLPRYVSDDVYIDYFEKGSHTSSQEIFFGGNLLDLENYVSAENMITTIFPTGKDGITIASVNPSGLDYISNPRLMSMYGMIATGIQFDSETEAELLADAKSTLNALAVLNQTITLNAIDLSELDATVDTIEIGDSVRAVSIPHGLDTNLECSAKTIDLVNPANSTITLGKTLKSLSKIIAMGGIKK